ncbi:MAG: hypothetical protein JPMHGGIA_01572 [Saprospiraceae bacterium]|nr:hypothetical protein [Saprospiraceae bacterium]
MKSKWFFPSLSLPLVLLVLSSCSSSRDISCPSFKHKRSESISVDYSRAKKHSARKVSEPRSAEQRQAAVENFYHEEFAVTGVPSLEPSLTGTLASVGELPLPVYERPTAPAMPAKPVVEKKKQGLGDKVKSYIAKKAIERELRKIEQKQEISSSDDDDAAPSSGGKSQLVALLLVIFVGGLGIHRFYLGYTTIGIIQLLTLGGCGIWALIDLIRIVTGDLKPKNGNYTETL